MPEIKCKACGGPVAFEPGAAEGVCQRCGAKQALPKGQDTDGLLRQAFLFLEDRDWQSAGECCELVLRRDPENALAYFGKLMAELHASPGDDLSEQKEPFDARPSCQQAMRYGDEALRDELESANAAIRARLEAERREQEAAEKPAESETATAPVRPKKKALPLILALVAVLLIGGGILLWRAYPPIKTGTFAVATGNEAIYQASLGEFDALMAVAHEESDIDRRFMLYAEAEAALLDAAVMMPYATNAGNETTFLITINLNRQSFALENGACASQKSAQQKNDALIAVQNNYFRKALLYAIDKEGVSSETSLIRNTYTPSTFVTLSKDVEDNRGHRFAAGTTYGEMLQYYLNKRGARIQTADGANGWYDPALARRYLKAAKEELGDLVSYPIIIDIPCNSQAETNVNRITKIKQSIEASLGTENVQVNLIMAETTEDYYGCEFSAQSAADVNCDLYCGQGWSPDYQEPATYLDTFCMGRTAEFLKALGLNG